MSVREMILVVFFILILLHVFYFIRVACAALSYYVFLTVDIRFQDGREYTMIIISITHFGRICKYLDEKQPHPKVRLNLSDMFIFSAA